MTKFSLGHRRSAKLTPEQVLEMRRLYSEENWSQRQLCNHFDISLGQVGRIVRGESWRHYTQIPTDQEIEHRMAVLPQPDPAALEESMARLAEKMTDPPAANTKPEDPLEAILRKRGGANPLARRPSDSDDSQTEEDSQS